VLLVASSDYNVNTVNTIAGLTALTASDIVEIVVYDTFSVFGGVFQGDLSADTITGDMFGSHQFEAKNIEGSTIPKGTPVYIAGHSGNDPEIAIADADDPAKMPAFGITTAAIANNNKGDVIVFGNYIGLDTSSFSVGDELYVSNTGTLVNTRPSASADKVQKIAKVIRSQSQNGQIFVMGAGRSNDVPNAITTNSINLSSTTTVDSVLDEDTMTSDSATALATQQSIKAYVDSQIGSNNELSEILTNGNTTGGNDISFADNDKAIFGAGSDLQIYHDGSHSRIDEQGTGVLFLQTNGNNIQLNKGTSENMLVANVDGSVDLYYDNSKKLATAATGVDVTGTVTSDGLTLDNAGGINSDVTNLSLTVAGGNADTSGGNITLYGSGSGAGSRIRFRGDSTERMRIESNGDISFYEDTGTTPKFFWDASAEALGIGTSSPNTTLPLTVEGSVSGIQFNDDGGNWNVVVDGGDFRVQQGTAGSGPSERMRIDTSGKLLINTTSSDTDDKLQIESPASGGGYGIQIRRNDNNTDQQIGSIKFGNTSDSDIGQIAVKTDGAANSGAMRFLTANSGTTSERMRIDSSGNVGIGTGSPQEQIHSYAGGSNALRVSGGANNNKKVEIGYDNTNGPYIKAGSSGVTGLQFYVDNTSLAATIDSSGNVGIGNSIPSSFNAGANNLVVGTGSGSEGITIYGGAESNIFFADGTATADNLRGRIEYSHGLEKMLFYVNNSFATAIDSSGNLLVNTTSGAGSAKLVVSADSVSANPMSVVNTKTSASSDYSILFYRANNIVGSVQTSLTATSYVTSSDYRLKTAVNYDWDATTRLKQLKPARFEWIADGDNAVPVDGFLAHEVQSVVPEAISGTHNEVNDEGNPVYQGIDQSKLVPLLVKTIQELEARITALETA